MGFAKYHEDDIRIFDDRMYYRNASFSHGIQSAYSKPVQYLRIEKDTSYSKRIRQTPKEDVVFCPLCRIGFHSREKLFRHVASSHGGAMDVVFLNGKRLREQENTVNKIYSLELYRFSNKNGVVHLHNNAGDTYSISTKTNVFKYNILPHLKTTAFSELVIDDIERPVVIRQYPDINNATIDRIISGKCKSVIYDEQISEEMLSPHECLIYLKMLIYEGEDTEPFIDRISYMGFERSRDLEELYYYHSLYTGTADQAIDTDQAVIISALIKTLNGQYDEAEAILRRAPKNQNEKNGCIIIISLLNNDKLSSEFLLKKYSPIGFVGYLVNELRRLSLYEGDGRWSFSRDMEELCLFKEYPLIKAVINLNLSIEKQGSLDQSDFVFLKNVTPLASIIYCQGIEDKKIKENIFKNMLDVHKNSMLLKEYVFSTDFSWVTQRITASDGEIYTKAVQKLNRDKKLGFSDRFLQSFPYDDTIQIIPLGGETVVGASCFIISYNGFYIMLDCGIDTKKYDDEAYPALDQWDREIDAIIITHAHLDHSGGIAKAHAMWPDARIIMTPPTKVLLKYILSDMARIKNGISDEFEIDNISIEKEVAYDTLNHIVPVDFGEKLKLKEDIEIILHSAGHIIGASMVELKIAGKSILYTGDFCSYNQMLVSSYDIESLPKNIDYLITEATYYKRNTVDWGRQYRTLKAEIMTAVKAGKSVLLPASAVGRSQELVCILGEMKLNRELPEHINLVIAGMAIPAVTQITPYMNERYESIVGLFEEFDGQDYPVENSIVIASSGSMSKGSASYKIADFWKKNYIQYTILANGYLDDETEESSRYLDQNRNVKRISLSTHADLPGLWGLIDYVLPKEISFVHRGQGPEYDFRSLIHTCKSRFHGDIICRNLETNRADRIFDIYDLMMKGNNNG